MRRCTPLISLLAIVLAPVALGNERPTFVGEYLLPKSSFNINYTRFDNRYWGGEDRAAMDLWQRALIDMQLFSANPGQRSWGNAECRYDSALEVLQQIRRELGEGSPYQTLWAANQARVLAACEDRAEQLQPIKPEGTQLPSRAASDFLYQQASWQFYRENYQAALPLYQQVEAQPDAPLRGFARYMTLRSLAASGRIEEAYNKAEQLLALPDLDNRELIANYRFVLMNSSNYNYRQQASEKLADQHLSWLLQVIRQTPEKAADIQRSQQDVRDATQQLASYFVAHVEGKGLDWWLKPEAPNNVRLRAVQQQARSNELVDWLQARETFNVFNSSWLWALHQPSTDYWQQNRVIVQHAWQRWQNTGHAEWLNIAISRVHPQDELAEAILAASEAQLINEWKGETLEYRQWLLDLWTQSIRLYIGRDDLPGALKLVEAHPNYGGLLGNDYSRDKSPAAHYRVLNWLIYQGRGEEARRWLTMASMRYPDDFAEEQTLLAPSWESAALWTDASHRMVYHRTPLWNRMLQLLPARSLSLLADDSQLPDDYRRALSRAAFTRAVLLEQDNDTLDRYAAQTAKLNPELRELVLQYSAERDHDAYIDLLLQVPRMRPLPNVEYERERSWSNYEPPKTQTAIDTINHNDNNWWCRVDPVELDEQVFAAAKILPTRLPWYITYQTPEQLPDVAPYLAKQRQWLAGHPYHQQVDPGELAALATVPSAPQYLSEAVNAHEHYTDWLPTRDAQARNERAANLSRAIRTTRYGCQRNGSHAAYSKQSFVLLKQYYGDTLWAKATPFWFGCSHFRGGCPVAAPATE